MVKKDKVPIEELFSRLKVYSAKDEHEGVLDCATRILTQDSNDESALRSKIIALVQLDRFNEAYETLKGSTQAKNNMVLAHAYVLYKLNKISELESLVESSKAGSDLFIQRGIKHSLAQAYYKSEDFHKVELTYSSLEKVGQPMVGNEESDMSVNKAAVSAQKFLNGLSDVVGNIRSELETGTYDEMFNIATAYIGVGDYGRAVELLREAKLSCENSEALSDDEIKSEVFPILIQAAYANQLLGNTDEAISILEGLDLYNSSNNDNLDSAVKNIAINNLLTMKGEENPHFAIRLLDSAGDSNKITSKQIQKQTEILGYNRLLLYNLAGRGINRMAKKYVNQHPNKSGIEAIAVTSEDAKKLRKRYKETPNNLSVAFALAQLYYKDNKIDPTTSTLEQLYKTLKSAGDNNRAYSPGLVGTLVSLFKLQGRDSAVNNLINEAIGHWSQGQHSIKNYNELIGIAASMLAGSDDESQRAKAYESFSKILQTNPQDERGIAGVLSTNNSTESSSSQQQHLEPIDSLISGIKVESLNEAGVQPLLQHKRKTLEEVKQQQQNKKSKKSHKPRLPKDYDPSKTPDPERWLPKRDRSTWKPKRKDKKNAKNTQGGQTADSTTTESGISNAANNTVKSNTNNNPAKNKKKKKGKK